MEKFVKFKDCLYTIRMLTLREFKIFFKDKLSLFFCFMAPVTFLLLYILFLRSFCLNIINSSLTQYLDPNTAIEILNEANVAASSFIDSWMFSGVLALASISIGLNANNILVTDKERGISKDLISTPTSATIVTMSYYLFNILINVIISLIIYAIIVIFLTSLGEYYINLHEGLCILGVTLLSCLLNTFMFTFIARFFKRMNSYASFTAVISAIVGFLIGAYIPTSIMPDYLQYITNLIPGTVISTLFRSFFTRGSIRNIENFLVTNNIKDSNEIIDTLKNYFNSETTIFNIQVDTYVLILIAIGFIVLFLILNMLKDVLETRKHTK